MGSGGDPEEEEGEGHQGVHQYPPPCTLGSPTPQGHHLEWQTHKPHGKAQEEGRIRGVSPEHSAFCQCLFPFIILKLSVHYRKVSLSEILYTVLHPVFITADKVQSSGIGYCNMTTLQKTKFHLGKKLINLYMH